MVDLLNKQQQQNGFHFCCGKLRENNFNKQIKAAVPKNTKTATKCALIALNGKLTV